MKKILLLACTALTLVLVMTIVSLNAERKERKRHQSNVTALMAENEAYRTKEGKWAMDVRVLELKTHELEQLRTQQADMIRAQGVRIKRLESMSTTNTKTKVEFTTPVVENIIQAEVDPVRSFSFDWSDPWVRVRGEITGGMVACEVQSVDTLTQLVYREPRRFLFIRYGTKSVRQKIISSNPHTKIVYSEHLNFTK